ncbi:hypothetical protein HID58_003501 [Brassica napus]|uniref:Uncharacterized protein n=1 Tax=Brassica napus TaxID=3708 RepID=A0ABQ8EQ98_BRANA|nr:hypothetical protein HID58_003501 [Brassica napus]
MVWKMEYRVWLLLPLAHVNKQELTKISNRQIVLVVTISDGFYKMFFGIKDDVSDSRTTDKPEQA